MPIGDEGHSKTEGASGQDAFFTQDPPDVDPTHRVGHLEIARKRPVSVKATDTIEQAVTMMMRHEFSQLPVMRSSTKVTGMFSWRSLAKRLAFGKHPTTVAEAMETAIVISAKRSLFEAARLIYETDYVLIEDEAGSICGILTSSDLSLTFSERSEPFLRLEQIEKHVRNRVKRRLSPEEIRVSLKRQFKPESDISDLTFGDYVQILRRPENWKKLGWCLKQEIFVKELDEIRVIRNRVMHFDSNGISPADLRKLQEFATFMREIQKATD
jgi:CBS domain-containing protein